jgi:hypothetical protein
MSSISIRHPGYAKHHRVAARKLPEARRRFGYQIASFPPGESARLGLWTLIIHRGPEYMIV